MKKSLSLLASMLFTLIAIPAFAGGIQVEGAWVRAAPPTVQVLAAYMTIKNTGSVGKTIVGANSPQFAKVEFHETLLRNGMASMVARDSLVVDSGGQVVLAPGGYHMMLIAPQRMIRTGDKLSLTINFSDGTSHNFNADVRKGSGKAMDHGKMQHGNMNQGNMNQGNMNHQNMMQQQNMQQHQQMMMQKHGMQNHQQMMMHHQNMQNMDKPMCMKNGMHDPSSCMKMQGGTMTPEISPPAMDHGTMQH